MGANIMVRKAAPNDLDDLARLNKLFNGVVATPNQLADRLGYPGCVEIPIVAQVNDRIVGFAGLRVVPSVFYEEAQAELTEIYVEGPFRRQGVGKALIDYAEDLARKAGAQEILLLTDKNNQAAQALYAAMGYQEWALAMGKSWLVEEEQE